MMTTQDLRDKDLKTYYVTFGLGTVLRHYYLAVMAYDLQIVALWLAKHEKLRHSVIYDAPPDPKYGLKPLLDEPEPLFYADAKHV